jgi:cobalt-zinc-cadmium efflux system protein
MNGKQAASIPTSTCYQQKEAQEAHDHGHGHDHGHAHDHDHGHDHAHGHGPGHGHTHRPAPGAALDRSFLFALILTGGFAAVEAVGGYLAHSLALISDAGHMATDAAALFVGLIAARLSRKPASASKSYGYGRAEVIGAFVNALTMLAVVVWIFVEAVQRVLQPEPIAGLWVMGIAAAGLVVNLIVLALFSHGHGNLNSRAAVLHVLGDLLGSVAAIIAGAVVTFTGWTLIDPLLSVAVALLILRSTWKLLLESANVLMEAVPEGIDYHAVERRLRAIKGVSAVHDLHLWQMSSEGRALSAHLLIESAGHWPGVLEEARGALRSEFRVGHVTLQPVWPQLARDLGQTRRHHEGHGHHDHAHEGQGLDHAHDHHKDNNSDNHKQETGHHGRSQSA